jgi:hypothetical protein
VKLTSITTSFTTPQPQQKCFASPTSIASRREQRQAKADSPVRRRDRSSRQMDHLGQAGRPRGRRMLARARESEHEHSPVPHFDAVAIQSNPTSELRAPITRAGARCVRLPGRRGQIGRSGASVPGYGPPRRAPRRFGSCRARSAGEPSRAFARRPGPAGTGRPTTACPERGRCSDAPCMHAAGCNASASFQ